MPDKVLITGASRGIGFATAKLLAASGWRVVGIARRSPDETFPGDFFAADLGDRRATAEALERICAAHEIDGIVNSVGLNVPEPLGEVDLDNLERVFDLNVRAAVQCTQAVLPGMRRRRYGRIVNISSRGALGRVKRTSYSAAKAGIVGMTRTWALELAAEGITANVVSPGPTSTEMFSRNNLEGPQGEENRRKFLADVPLGRFGQPEEIAFAIAFFLDRRASFITGQLVHACGGSSVGPAAL
jgi:NAD(P)-dependent dehydrogenase (short-subunit alcohol dehydrogenase family)